MPHNLRMALWRSVLARDRRRPAGFIRPAQPVLLNQIPTGPEWVHELKWDGYRIIARRDGGRVREPHEAVRLHARVGRREARGREYHSNAQGDMVRADKQRLNGARRWTSIAHRPWPHRT